MGSIFHFNTLYFNGLQSSPLDSRIDSLIFQVDCFVVFLLPSPSMLLPSPTHLLHDLLHDLLQLTAGKTVFRVILISPKCIASCVLFSRFSCMLKGHECLITSWSPPYSCCLSSFQYVLDTVHPCHLIFYSRTWLCHYFTDHSQ